MHKKCDLILASGSQIRGDLLRNAGLTIEAIRPQVDEDGAKAALIAEGASPRDIADTLAELKARKVSQKRPGALVLGCDQVLDFKGEILSKPTSEEEVTEQLTRLSGQGHKLLSAAVVYEDGQPIWRHVGVVSLTMRQLSPAFIDAYVARNWPGLSESVGGYKLEEEGSRLFVAVRGEYFDVLGLPLLPLLNWLTLRGVLET